jgi:predicted phosphodiesterase
VSEGGFLFIGDVHLSSVPPARRKDDYATAVLAKLSLCADIARRENLIPVMLGDMFHRPKESDEALKTRLARVLRQFHRPLICNVGNHDIRGETLQDGDSLLYLAESGLIEVPEKNGSFEVVELSTGIKVGYGLIPYGQEIPDDVSALFPEADGVFLVTHHDLAFEGAYPGALPLKEISGCSLVINGHMHLRKPFVDVNGTCWCNFGSMTSTAIDAVGHRPIAVEFRPEREDIFSYHDLGGEEDVFDLISTLAPSQPVVSFAGRDFAKILSEEIGNEARRTADGAILEEEMKLFLQNNATPACAQAVLSLLKRVVEAERT